MSVIFIIFFLSGRSEGFIVCRVEMYLNGCQVLLLLRRRLMDKPQPVGIAGIARIQNIQNISFTATDLEGEKKNETATT